MKRKRNQLDPVAAIMNVTRVGRPCCAAAALENRLRGNAAPPGSWKGARGFTLLEVLLAVAIAAGMLTVVLFFYTQTANLRVQLFYEASKISAVRLLLDRLTADLSNARRCESLQVGLSGASDSLELVRLDIPSSFTWTNALATNTVTSTVPFRLIRYATLRSLGETNVSGLTRSEDPLQRKPVEFVADSDPSSTNGVPWRRAPMTIDQFSFLRFRYWNGSSWLDTWSAPELPAGVEVSLGAEPLPEETTPEEYPFELFRRVIYLPGHAARLATNEHDPLLQEDRP
jgi:prepilin-type N-terminal cleavage/methylation domain-containing protein